MKFNELTNMMQKPEPKPDTYEAGMALNQLLKIGTHAIKIHNMIKDDQEMEAWVAKKIDLASNYVKSVHGYTAGEKAGTYDDAGMTEDTDINDLKRWYNRYSGFEGFNGDKLPFGLYMQMAQTGVPTDGMEAGEARQAIADQNPNLDPNDAESLAGSAEEIPGVDFDKADAPITNRMKSELATIMGVDAIGEEEITKAMKMLGVSTGMESNSESNDGELSRLKELSGIEEDTNDDIIQWAKKYSQYKNLEDDNLIEALYDYAFELGITQFIFEVGELQAAERELGKKQEDWEDKEINAAMEMSPISNGLLDDLHRILPGNAELEQKLDSIRGMLQKAGLKEDKYQPFPEADEITFEDDDAFYEAFGELGFPEDETELFDAEYRGRKVPLNKPMRGDVKKFKVYVKDPKSGNVKKVNFGHGGSSARKAGQKTMKIRKSNPKARKSFRARHNCANPGPKTKARYWSCRAW